MKKRMQVEMTKKKIISQFLLIIFLISDLGVLALPGGPSQPEAESFKPIGVSDNVNHFNGAFTYSIPLMDVDGFPIKLDYTGNPSLESDASWVGLGWDLNLGSINRQMRGIPDEFDGTDKMEKYYKVKPNNTYGVKFNFNVQLANFEKLKRSLSLGLGYGIYYNNYRGMKTEISVSPGFNSTKEIADDKTGNIMKKRGVKLNPSVSINSSSESGLSVTPTVSLSFQSKEKDKRERNLGGVNLGMPMSAREGIKGLNYGFNANHKATKSVKNKNGESVKKEYDKSAFSGGGSLSFTSPSAPPFIQNPMKNEMYAFTLNGGGDAWTVDFGVGAIGSYVTNYVDQKSISRPLYGYMNSEKGKDDQNGVLDFQREKDIPFKENVPVIGIPQANYDLFTVNQPSKSLQFRAYRTTSGIYKDPKTENETISHSLGGEIHGGAIFEGGATLAEMFGGTTSEKWKNTFTGLGDFQEYDLYKTPLKESIIIKSQNELASTNEELYLNLSRDEAINIANTGNSFRFKNKDHESVVFPSVPIEPDYSKLGNSKNFPRTTLFSYLTTEERKIAGLDKELFDMESGVNRFGSSPDKYKDNHISEITVANPDGTRAVYGLPLYNNFSRDVNFSVSKTNFGNGLITYDNSDASPSNNKGTEELFSSEQLPAYPHTWMLTGLLSPDYADLTGNGISSDDRGNAHKINYSLKNENYIWRIPASNSGHIATYNPGLESDLRDDKASFSEGSREEWYVHSVESKNKIAFFILEARQDAHSSHQIVGGKNSNSKKYYLKQIKLYSRADWEKNQSNAEVIKAVNFEYDYSSCDGAPGANTGKLTLKKVYFTYGKSSRSQSNTYEFEYNNDSYYDYATKAMDRWGNFKKHSDNPNGLNNNDFPYSTQSKSTADKNAKAWLLKKISLPSGGDIHIDYESHTYGFVQNKRAAYMSTILGVGKSKDGPYSNVLYDRINPNVPLSPVVNHNFIFFKFDPNAVPSTEEEMKSLYFYDAQNLEFQNNLYYRCKVNLTKRNGQMRKEYIPGYAKIKNMGIYANDPNIGWIELEQTEGEQAIAFSTWQFLKSSNPKLAYPYNDVDYTGPVAAITGMASFMGNIREMLQGYADVAKSYKIGQTIETDKSYIRLLKPDLMKYGGGARVSKIEINDNWDVMSGSGTNGKYGQEYKYETLYNGKTVSSGVAEYEPLLGGDENPFKKPINYSGAKGLFAPTSTYYIDEPVGENFFPSPSVGYSSVLVRSINSHPDSNSGSGHQEYNFYTAKDFPTKVDRTSLSGDNISFESPPFYASFIKVFNRSGVWASQGFSVEVNDMHGKPKSEKTYNHKGALIAETNYKYWVDDENKAMPNLVNEIPTIGVDNTVQNTLMGVNFDFYNDLRKSKTETKEFSVEVGGGMFPLGFLPGFFVVPLGTFGINSNEYHSASTMKYIHKKGILKNIEKTQDGSRVMTENKLWDRNTGDVILSSVQNEYEEPIYNLKMPAYWKYEGMNFGYKNSGVNYSVKFDSKGVMEDIVNKTSSNMMNVLYPGDEVYVKSYEMEPSLQLNIDERKYWVVKDFNTSNKFLIDHNGDKLLQGSNSILTMGEIKVLRSGRRNLITAPMFNASSLANPIENGSKIELSQDKKILNASAQTYSDDWKIFSNYKPMPQDSCCNESIWYEKINRMYDDNKSDFIPPQPPN